MKKIVLIGDSIKMGYVDFVRDALTGVAEVYSPEENCRYSVNVLRFAHEWKKKGEWPDDVDLVHWNAGLWDALELFFDEPLMPIDAYERVIPRIDRRLRMLFPQAKIVFATSTAVLEDRCKPEFRRHNATIEAYNAAACRALAPTDTCINDLYPTSRRCPEHFHSDAVHYYTAEGTDMIGGQVLATICRELGISAADVKLDGYDPEKFLVNPDVGY